MKINIKKLPFIIAIIISITLMLALITSYLNPVLFTIGLAKDGKYKAINTKLDWNNPTITYLPNAEPCPKDRLDIKKFEYIIAHPRRQNNGFLLAEKNILGQASCNDLDEFLELVKTKDLSIEGQNPNPDKFQNGKVQTSLQKWISTPIEERYYNPSRSDNVHSEDINDFKKLKKGMTDDQVNKIVGLADIGFGSGGGSLIQEVNSRMLSIKME
jgi:hypothetical protein